MKRLALLLAMTACGRELHHTADAGAPDASVDAPDDNGEPTATAVRLTITRLGVAVQGVTVVFQDASSTVIATGKTDLNGRAWAEMPSGGFVTAIEKTGMNSDELTTFASVAAGDALRLDHTPQEVGTDRPVTINVSLDAGANDGYTVVTSCGTGGADATGAGFIELSQCGATADVVVLSTLDGLSTGRGFHLANVPMPLEGGLVSLTGTFDTFTAVNLTYQGVPAQVASIVGQQVLSATARTYTAADAAVPAGGTATIPVAIPTTTATVLTETTLYPTSGEFGQQQLFSWGAPAASVTTNIGAEMLPAYASAPVYDLASHAITWTERAGGTADLVRAGIQVHRDDIPEGHAWKWRIAGARTGASITFPTLPNVTGFELTPSEGDTIVVDELTEARLPGGFAPWRTQVFVPFSRMVTGATGTMAVQMLYTEAL